MPKLWTRSAATLAAVALTLSGGCDGQPKVGTVTGAVTLDGKPLVGAQLTFVCGEMVASARTDEKGLYRAENVIVGPVKVGVILPPEDPVAMGDVIKRTGQTSVDANGQPRAAAPPPPPTPTKPKVIVPDRYRDPLTSQLTHTATSGESTYDIALTK